MKARRKAPDAPLDAVGALKSMFEEQRKAAKVVRVAVGAALAALHRDAVPVDGVGALAASTARCLVGHCGETKAVLQILGDASSQAQRAADALAKTELMLSCESGDVEQCKRALAKGADPDLDPDVAAELKKANGRTCLLVALENGHPGV